MRPSWQIDFKWVLGLALLFSILVSGLLYSVSQLTERESATGMFAGAMAALMKEQEGDPEAYEQVQARAAARPDEDVTIEGISFPIKGRELIGLSSDEAIDLVVARTAEILYTDGPEAIERFFEDSEGDREEGSGAPDLSGFSLLTQDGHDAASRYFKFSLIPIAVLVLPVAFFSRRFGRLGSPAVILAVGTVPFVLLWVTVRAATRAPGDGVEGALAAAVSPTVSGLANDFLAVFLIGAALTGLAAAGHLALLLWRWFRSRPTPDDTTAAPVPATEPGDTTGKPAPKARRPAPARAPSAQLKRTEPAADKDKQKEKAA